VKNLASGNNIVLNASSSAVTTTGSGPFSFNDGSSTPASTNQYQVFNPFSAGSAHVFAAGTGLGTATQTMPMQFSSPASTPFALTGSAVFFFWQSHIWLFFYIKHKFCVVSLFGSSSTTASTAAIASTSAPSTPNSFSFGTQSSMPS
jgi:hypothetical protein